MLVYTAIFQATGRAIARAIQTGLFLFALYPTLPLQAQQLTGRVLDETGEPLPFASVYVRNSTNGVSTNAEGEYRLSLTKGRHEIVFHYIGYKQKIETVDIGAAGVQLSVQLQPANLEISEVVITGEDPAYRIMREAIARREINKSKASDYSCEVYIKGFNKLLDAPKKVLGQDVGDMGGILDSATRSGVLYLSESVSKLYVQSNPPRQKEMMISSKVSGRENGFSINRTALTNFNLYEERIEIERDILSPLADNAFSYYDFRLEGSYQDGNGYQVYKIAVLPKRPADPTYGGFVHIVDGFYNLAATELTLTGMAIKQPVLDTLWVIQEYVPVQLPDKWLLLSQTTRYKFGFLGFKVAGFFNGVFSKYYLQAHYEDGFFTREAFKVEESALKRDSAYWENARPVPLTEEEKTDYVRKDSLSDIWESKAYRDSMDRINNRFKPFDLLTGYTWQNTHKRIRAEWPPAVRWIQFNTVQGWLLNVNPEYQYYDSEKRSKYWRAVGTLNYGFSEQRFRGGLSVQRRFESIHYTELDLGGGVLAEQFDQERQITPLLNSLYSLLDKRNYLKLYEKSFLRAAFRRTLAPGLRLEINAEYADRRPLVNTSNYSWNNQTDRTYTLNGPVYAGEPYEPYFNRHQALIVGAEATIRFGATYSSYPERRFYQYAEAPVIRLQLRQAVPLDRENSPSWLFGKAEIGMNEWKWGLAGYSGWRVVAGGFLYRRAAGTQFIDAWHPNGNQTLFGQPDRYLRAYYLMPYYTFSTFDPFVELHWQHHFQGWILDKIPLVRRLNWKEVLSFNLFYADGAAVETPVNTGNKPYWEVAFGFEHIGVKAFRPLRIDFVGGFRGMKNTQTGLVLGISL